MALGQSFKIKCVLGMDNNVTFVTNKIQYKNVLLWNLIMSFLVHSSLQSPFDDFLGCYNFLLCPMHFDHLIKPPYFCNIIYLHNSFANSWHSHMLQWFAMWPCWWVLWFPSNYQARNLHWDCVGFGPLCCNCHGNDHAIGLLWALIVSFAIMIDI
jgi:hypothetical protein